MKHLKPKNHTYFITTNTKDHFPVFEDARCCNILLHFMDFFRAQFGFLIYGYIIMPDHFHWIILTNEDSGAKAPATHSTRVDGPKGPSKKEYGAKTAPPTRNSRVDGPLGPSKQADISVIMGRLKGRTAYEINKLLNRSGTLWQENYYEHVIRNRLDFKEKTDYIHKNPYRAGLVQNLEDYKYSSYINYCLGDNSLIKIDYPGFDVIK